MAYLYKDIICPFCEKMTAKVTYENSHLYKCDCYKCKNTILHEDTDWSSAVRFFEHLLIAEECR